MSNVKIVSDGTAQGTEVFVGDETLKGITRIEIEPLIVGGTVRAKITIDMVSLRAELNRADIECTDVLTEEQIKEALLGWASEMKGS